MKEVVQRAFDLTTKLIQKHGPRLAGSDASRNTADDLFNEMEDFCDKTVSDEFHVHAGAFLGWIQIVVLTYLLGLLFLWLKLPLIAFLVVSFGLLVMLLQFFLYKPFLDPFYKGKIAKNVYGMIEPKNEATSQVIISGHHDSARIFNFFIHQPNLYNVRTTGSIALLVIMYLISVLEFLFIDSGALFITLNVLLTLGIFLVVQMWFFASKEGTPGAGDNLIASALAIELGRYFAKEKENGNQLDHTRIILASFDAEEEGLRGARDYANRYEMDMMRLPTTVLNMDCLYQKDELFFLTSDINGSVELSESLADELIEIGKKNKIYLNKQPIAFLTGGTDAGELAKKGARATTLIGMPWTNDSRSAVYHTPKDTVDKIEKEAIEAAAIVFSEYIKNIEK